MLITKPLRKVLEEHPEFKGKLGWSYDQYSGILENPQFGKVEQIVVCREDGTPIFDQYSITETPGSVILPYDNIKSVIRVGLITQNRYVPGKDFLEAPRGFGEENEEKCLTAYRELLEETGFVASEENISYLGKVNHNTAFYTTDIAVFSAQFGQLEEIINLNGDNLVEKITKIAPYSFRDLRKLQQEGRIECGITNSALFLFGCRFPEFYQE